MILLWAGAWVQNLVLGPGKDLEARPTEQPVRGQLEGQLQGSCSWLPVWGPWLHWVQNGLVRKSIRAGCPAHPITQHSTQSCAQAMLAGWPDEGHRRQDGGQGCRTGEELSCRGIKRGLRIPRSDTLTQESLPSIPAGSINVPNKNGNLIFISSKKKVTSTPGKSRALAGLFLARRPVGEPAPHAPRRTQEQLTQTEKRVLSERLHLPHNGQNCMLVLNNLQLLPPSHLHKPEYLWGRGRAGLPG